MPLSYHFFVIISIFFIKLSGLLHLFQMPAAEILLHHLDGQKNGGNGRFVPSNCCKSTDTGGTMPVWHIPVWQNTGWHVVFLCYSRFALPGQSGGLQKFLRLRSQCHKKANRKDKSRCLFGLTHYRPPPELTKRRHKVLSHPKAVYGCRSQQFVPAGGL